MSTKASKRQLPTPIELQKGMLIEVLVTSLNEVGL